MRRIEIDVEKKILVDGDGERHGITGSTSEYGPARFSVTWGALATLAMLTGQYALPLNRLGTLLSSPEKRFRAGSLGRMLHYVAQPLVPIYLELGTQLSSSDYLAGDDTSCRVLEVSSWFEKVKAEPAVARSERPPLSANVGETPPPPGFGVEEEVCRSSSWGSRGPEVDRGGAGVRGSGEGGRGGD